GGRKEPPVFLKSKNSECGCATSTVAAPLGRSRPWSGRGQWRTVPDSDRLIVRGTGQAPAVWAPAHAMDNFRVSLEHQGLLAGVRVPDPDGLVVGAAGQALAIRAPTHARNPVRVPLQCQHLLAGVCVPDAHRLVPGGTRQPPAVGTPAHPMDAFRVPR